MGEIEVQLWFQLFSVVWKNYHGLLYDGDQLYIFLLTSVRQRGRVIVFWFQNYVVFIYFCSKIVLVFLRLFQKFYIFFKFINFLLVLSSFAMLVFELFLDGMFPCLRIRSVWLSERNFPCMFLRLVLLAFIDGFFVLFSISA